MNCYIIEEFATFEKVTFYTFRHEDSDLSETDKFVERFKGNSITANDKKYLENFNNIFSWIKKIGKKGAFDWFFRPEGKANALPSKTEIGNKLRLLCVRLSDTVVILGNGGIKTSQTIQNSSDLSSKFYLMGDITDEINQLLQTGEWKLKDKCIQSEYNLEICL